MQQCSSELVTNIILYINKFLRTLLSYLIFAAIRGFLCTCGFILNRGRNKNWITAGCG